MRDRALIAGLLAGAVGLLLACAPGFDQPLTPSWQCPTATPEATRIVGYQPTPPGVTSTPGLPSSDSRRRLVAHSGI